MQPHTDFEQTDHETGFGTGLRAQLARHRGEPDDALAEPEGEAAPAVVEEPVEQPRTEEEELRLELEAALAREARLRAAFADEQARAQERVAELERALGEARASLEEAHSADAPPAGATARDVLRDRAERSADLLWRTFEVALEAVHADGRPDHATRMQAARAILGEAYAPDAPARVAEADLPVDELADLRARKAHQQPQ
jgi:hypothetical protein